MCYRYHASSADNTADIMLLVVNNQAPHYYLLSYHPTFYVRHQMSYFMKRICEPASDICIANKQKQKTELNTYVRISLFTTMQV